MYAEKIEYKPIVNLDEIPRRMWIDYDLGLIKNALHKYYCTGDKSCFDNKQVWDAHYNIISYKLHLKEKDPEAVQEITLSLTSKIFTNILNRDFSVHPAAYSGYLKNSIRFAWIDHIRKQKVKPPLILFEEPLLAQANYWSMGEVHDPYNENTMRLTPEETVSAREVDKYLIFLLQTLIDSMILPGGRSLLYLCYHWYVHRSDAIFKKIPEKVINSIKLVVNSLELYYPLAKYLKEKDKSEECYV